MSNESNVWPLPAGTKPQRMCVLHPFSVLRVTDCLLRVGCDAGRRHAQTKRQGWRPLSKSFRDRRWAQEHWQGRL